MILSGRSISDNFVQLQNTTPAVSEYFGPSPPAGSPPHRYTLRARKIDCRYTLLIYAQPTMFDKQTLVSASTSIFGFNLTQFTTTLGFGTPLGGNLFYVGPDSSSSGSTTTVASTPTRAPMSNAFALSARSHLLLLTGCLLTHGFWHGSLGN